MKRVGILAEKPSQARNFAKAFGGMSGVTNLAGEPVEYGSAAARGHLSELKQPSQQVSADKQDRYKSWDLNNLPWDRQDIAFKFSVRGDVRSVVADIKQPSQQVSADKQDRYKSWDLNNLPWDRQDIAFKFSVRGDVRSVVADIKRAFKACDEIKQDRYKSWDLNNLPWDRQDIAFKFSVRGDVRSVVADIKRAFKACDEIVIATDDDPTYEGTALACEIIQEAPLHAREYSRMYFVDESAPQVAQAFKTRKVIPNISTFNEWITARFRSRWDYMAGLQLTRAASSFAPYGTFVRTGRLKSAMVVLIGNQLAAYNNYVKKPYFTSRFVDDHEITSRNRILHHGLSMITMSCI